jgi:hypothetical protein
MFKRKLTDINDQDTLNYLHWVFEISHGQLDSWLSNSLFQTKDAERLRFSLSQINQTVHRCESNSPKIRVVYFDLPKIKQFSEEDYKLFTTNSEFGGVYTLYADVGKNLESFAIDDDVYVDDFVPNLHYSVDFQIKFYDTDGIEKQRTSQEYLEKNLQYFLDKGYTKDDPRLTVGAIKIAQLKYSNRQQVLDEIKDYDNIQSIFVY